jgi:hypothetical protein
MGTGKVGNFTRLVTPSRRVATFTIGAGLVAILAALLVPLMASASHSTPALPLTSPLTGPNEVPDCTGSDPLVSSLGLPSANISGSNNRAHAGEDDAVAVWANATNYPDTTAFDMSTSESIIHGEAVSRSHMKIAGSNNQIRHNTEYGLANRPSAAFDLSGQNTCFSGDPAIAQVSRATPAQPQGFPIDFDLDDDGNFLEHYAPGSPAALAAMADPAPGPQYFVCGVADPDGAGTAAAIAPGCSGGKMDVNVQGTQLPTGLYYVTGEALLSGQALMATITLVSGGNLKVNGSSQSEFSPYTQSLLFLGNFGQPNSNAGEDAVKIEGSVSLFEGVVHAPNGRATLALHRRRRVPAARPRCAGRPGREDAGRPDDQRGPAGDVLDHGHEQRAGPVQRDAYGQPPGGERRPELERDDRPVELVHRHRASGEPAGAEL